MTNSQVSAVKILTMLIIGGMIGASLTNWRNSNSKIEDNSEQKPLYWVAPMDANYRRDQPGLSPMGMALIPVYETGSKVNDAGPGTVHISPDVINNIGVRTAEVEYKPLQNNIVTVGYVKYDEDQLIHIHPRISGWVEKLYVKAAGDPVRKGTPLYALYSPELVNAQEEFVQALSRKNTRLITGAENRLQALLIPPSFIQQLRKTKKIQQSITFFAPRDGVIDNLNIREGFYVQPGTTMFSIATLNQVWVEAEVFERQSGFLKRNAQVSMHLDFLPSKTWQGKIDYIYPTLNATTRTVRLRIRVNNKDKLLKPNMFARIIIHASDSKNTLLIPREALIRTGMQDRVVLALGDGSFKSIAVTAGREDHSHIEILKGLSEGERIVTSAQFLLDSESSKTSDFLRLHHGQDSTITEHASIQSAEVEGTVNSIDLDTRTINISRGPIEKWQRPAATMDFIAGKDIDFKRVSVGQAIQFRFDIVDGDFIIRQIAEQNTVNSKPKANTERDN